MTRLFVYSSQFLKCWDAMGLNDRHLSLLERQLLINPKVGDVIEGTGGARKLRIQLEDNRGKSGGGRVIYIDLEQLSKIYMLFAYPKKIQENLTDEQKRMIRIMIGHIKKEGMF